MNWIKVRNYFLAAALVAAFFIAVNIESFQKDIQNDCIKCHIKTNPVMVEEWQQSTMAFSGMECIDCHGNSHNNEKNADKAVLPSIKVCGECHQAQADQFSAGKHGKAEEALYVSAMGKKVKTQFPAVFDRSCAVCHNEICKDGGQCDACHTGHRFSAREAKNQNPAFPATWGTIPSTNHTIFPNMVLYTNQEDLTELYLHAPHAICQTETIWLKQAGDFLESEAMNLTKKEHKIRKLLKKPLKCSALF